MMEVFEWCNKRLSLSALSKVRSSASHDRNLIDWCSDRSDRTFDMPCCDFISIQKPHCGCHKPNSLCETHRFVVLSTIGKRLFIMLLFLAASALLLATCESHVLPADRIDCIPLSNSSASSCTEKDCLFDPSATDGSPKCFLDPSAIRYAYKNGAPILNNPAEKPSGTGWNIMKQNRARIQVSLKSNASISGSNPAQTLNVVFESMSTRVMGFRISEDGKKRFRVPNSIVNLAIPRRLNKPFYRVEYVSDPNRNFAFKIVRESNDVTIFDTSLGGLVFEEDFIQIITKLPSKHFYGFGESHHGRFRHEFDWKSSTLFSRHTDPSLVDQVRNIAGVHPFYMVIEEDGGNAHGMFLLNSNPIEYKLQPSPALTIRAYGGIFDFIVCMGSTPNDVMIEYLQVVGRPTLPPFWALGLHVVLSGNESDLQRVEQLERNGIPVDVLHLDLKEAAATELLHKMRNHGTHIVQSLLPYENLSSSNGPFVLDASGNKSLTVYDSKCQPVLLKDYLSDSVLNGSTNFHASAIDSFVDGFWLRYNQPFSRSDCQNKPSVMEKNVGALLKQTTIFHNTIPMDSRHTSGNMRHRDAHNLYGLSQSLAEKRFLQGTIGKRGLIVSESTFASSGKVAATWLPTSLNQSLENAVRQSIVAAFEYNTFGVTVAGTDVVDAPHDESYCRMFQLVSLFQVMPRSHLHDCATLSGEPFSSAVSATKKALETRASLVPYLYSLFFHGWMEGEPIIRPLFYEYSTKYHDDSILDVDDQFLWGPAVLFVPHIQTGSSERSTYLPTDIFYRFGTGRAGERFVGTASRVPIQIPEDEIGVFLRAGYVAPGFKITQLDKFHKLRTAPLQLHIAAHVSQDGSASANGNWFWDDGDDIDTIENKDYLSWFIYNRWQEGNFSRALLDYDVERNDVEETSKLFFESFLIYGYENFTQGIPPVAVRVNGREVTEKTGLRVKYNPEYQLLEISYRISAANSFKLEILLVEYSF